MTNSNPLADAAAYWSKQLDAGFIARFHAVVMDALKKEIVQNESAPVAPEAPKKEDRR